MPKPLFAHDGVFVAHAGDLESSAGTVSVLSGLAKTLSTLEAEVPGNPRRPFLMQFFGVVTWIFRHGSIDSSLPSLKLNLGRP